MVLDAQEGATVLRGRYGIGWMLTAWIGLTVIAMAVAIWAGPQIGLLFSGG